MALNIDLAISIWRTDNGYRIINSFLTNSKTTKDYIYHQENNKTIEYNDKTYNTIDVINVIKQHMTESDNPEPEIYYRGGTANNQRSFIKTSFISVASDEEQASSYVDGDCCLYKVFVYPSVKRCKIGIEYETLLENGLYWEYIGKQGKYHMANIKQHQFALNVEEKDKNLIEDKKELTEDKKELTEDEVKSWLDLYKDEYLLFNDDITLDGFIDYIEKENETLYKNNNILIQKLAEEMISKIGGKKRNQMISKKNKKKTKRFMKKTKRCLKKTKRCLKKTKRCLKK
jgi:hypothetical protein